MKDADNYLKTPPLLVDFDPLMIPLMESVQHQLLHSSLAALVHHHGIGLGKEASSIISAAS